MVARHVRDHHLLGRRDAEQLGVHDQVVRVLVVPVVADVVADVVQQRGVGERRAVVGRAARAGRRSRRRAAARAAAPAAACGCLVVAALGEVAHRALARRARVGDDRRDTRELEQQPLADAVARHVQLARLDARQHLRGDGKPGDDDVGALGIEAGHGATLLGRHRGERVEDVLDVLARHHGAVHVARREQSAPREVNRREVGERAARADHAARRASRCAGSTSRRPSRTSRRSCWSALGVAPVAQEPLGEPERAEGKRDELVEHAVGRERELERAAADVHHDRAAGAEVEVRERAAEREPRLVLAVDDADARVRSPGARAPGTRRALPASRTALVATASMRSAPSWRASVAMRPSASAARSIDCVPSEPVAVEARAEPRQRLHLVDDA